VSGTTELRLDGRIERLPAVWGRLPWWLLLELYVAAKLAKGVWYWLLCGFSWRTRLTQRATRQYGTAFPGQGRPRDFTKPFWPGLFGAHRFPVVWLLSLPWYVVLSFFNFLRVAWVLWRWDYPPTGPTLGSSLFDEEREVQRKRSRQPAVGPEERRRRRRLALAAVVWDGLLFSVWMGPLWRPRVALGKGEILVTRYGGETYFAQTRGTGNPVEGWRRRGDALQIARQDSVFEYRLD
jgi:hypothetical protein